MPFKRDRTLFDVFEDALRASGWAFYRLSAPLEHPARYRLSHEAFQIVARIYIWNTSPGGKNRPLDEWRIQPTNVGQRFEPEENGLTIILGYWSAGGVFTGYDYNFHAGPIGSSSSMQIRRSALDAAISDGMSVFNRGNGELAVVFRPELLGAYISEMSALHAAGSVPSEVGLIEKIAHEPETVSDEQIATDAPPSRQHAMVVVRRAIRDAKFRKRVLDVYGHKCAFCGVQLDLLDAAHILPVEHPDGTDGVSNGVAACPLHHRAYDRGLIGFGTDHTIIVNAAKVAALEASGLGGGLEKFRDALLATIILPADPKSQPGAKFIEVGNSFRGFLA